MIPANSPGRGDVSASLGPGKDDCRKSCGCADHDMETANAFLRTHWIPFHNQNFTVRPQQPGTAFVPYTGSDLNKIFSHQEERVVANDNTVSFGKLSLQVQPDLPLQYVSMSCSRLSTLGPDLESSLWPHLLGRYNLREKSSRRSSQHVAAGRQPDMNVIVDRAYKLFGARDLEGNSVHKLQTNELNIKRCEAARKLVDCDDELSLSLGRTQTSKLTAARLIAYGPRFDDRSK